MAIRRLGAMRMRRMWPVLAALQLSGCVAFYPYHTVIKRTGRLMDETGAPISSATVSAVVYTMNPYDRPLAYSTTQSSSTGGFSIAAKHRSEAIVSFVGGEIADTLCVACKKGYETTYFPCAESGPVTMKSLSLKRPRSEQLKERRYYPLVRADSFTQYLLSRCDLHGADHDGRMEQRQ